MRVVDVMSTDLLAVRPSDSMREAARSMHERGVAGALVDPGGDGSPGILTARDVLEMAASAAAEEARVEDHFTRDATCAAPEWPLERVAGTMVSGGFRHLIVVDGGAIKGMLSMRDIARRWTKERARHSVTIQIRQAMNRDFPTIARGDTLREAAQAMIDQEVGAAVVEPSGRWSPPGLATERDVLRAVAAGHDPARFRIGGELETRTTYSAPDWSLKQAAEAMLKGGFQHVVVVDATGVVGIISMRDVLACWLR